jgi:CBS domain-containing protein
MADRDPLEYQDEAYFAPRPGPRVFDSRLLREGVNTLPARKPITVAGHDSVTDAVRAMKSEQRGVIVVTTDGSPGGSLLGIFTERDVLLRIVDGGRNPAVLPVSDVMTADPECVDEDASIAEALKVMSVGGFRHVPVVDSARRVVHVVSVRDVVQFLVESFPAEVLNSGGTSQRQREGG